jgi:hypothetical protein
LGGSLLVGAFGAGPAGADVVELSPAELCQRNLRLMERLNPERIPFFLLVNILCARELRKVGVNQPFAGALSSRGAASR